MTDRATPSDEFEFTLDGRTVRARRGELLIAAAERAGTFIPRFCYHPRMEPVGVCRMCLVEVSGPRGATLMPSCFIEAAPGMEVVSDSDKVKKAQDGVLEFLLINHPLDCPVCDKGGECPLQDQTLAYGPGETRFVEEKRHFEKPVPISELVLLDRERCIQCSRCTRFADEVAGEAQIDFVGRGEQIQVSTFPELPFTSYFSGNTVQICPVGALTAAPYRFAARPWDLDQVESTCTTCAVGCRVAVQSSSNRLTRLLGIDVDPVNHGWLCDKGRFAADAVNREDRLTEPQVRKDGALVPVSWHEALAAVATGLRSAADAGPDALGVIGGARLSNEGAYAWARLAKGVLGTDSVDAQLGDGLPAEVVLSLPRATIDQAASAGAVVLLTGDLREELPVLFLRLRSAAVDGGVPLVELSPQATSLTGHAAVSLRYGPGGARALVDALVSEDAPPASAGGAADVAEARRLLGGGPVVVVVGRPSLAEDAELVADAACALARALPEARFLPALRRGNVAGALDMGLAPGVLPGRVGLEAGRAWFEAAWGAVPAGTGRDTAQILAAAAGDQAQGPPVTALVLLGSDPLSDFPDRRLARRALESADVRRGGGHRTRRRPRARRRRPPRGRGPRASRHDHQHRGPDLAARPEARPAGTGLARLDDRRRTRRAPGSRPRVRLGGRRVGRDRAGGGVPPRDHPGRARTRRCGRRRGGAARRQPGHPRPAGAARPGRRARCGVGRAPGDEPPGGPGGVPRRRDGRPRGGRRPRPGRGPGPPAPARRRARAGRAPRVAGRRVLGPPGGLPGALRRRQRRRGRRRPSPGSSPRACSA